MPKIQFDCVVEFADGHKERVVADQRDFARWEVQDFAQTAGDKRHLQARFLAWSALSREGRYKTTFEKFNLIECVEVNLADEEDEGEQGLDPGRSTPAAAS